MFLHTSVFTIVSTHKHFYLQDVFTHVFFHTRVPLSPAPVTHKGPPTHRNDYTQSLWHKRFYTHTPLTHIQTLTHTHTHTFTHKRLYTQTRLHKNTLAQNQTPLYTVTTQRFLYTNAVHTQKWSLRACVYTSFCRQTAQRYDSATVDYAINYKENPMAEKLRLPFVGTINEMKITWTHFRIWLCAHSGSFRESYAQKRQSHLIETPQTTNCTQNRISKPTHGTQLLSIHVLHFLSANHRRASTWPRVLGHHMFHEPW